MDFAAAIESLYPGACWSMTDDSYETLWWSEENQDQKPTKEDLKKEVGRLKRQAKKNSYKKDRAAAYPSIEDQLDMLWHMMDQGDIPGAEGTWYKAILEVKEKYPK